MLDSSFTKLGVTLYRFLLAPIFRYKNYLKSYYRKFLNKLHNKFLDKPLYFSPSEIKLTENGVVTVWEITTKKNKPILFFLLVSSFKPIDYLFQILYNLETNTYKFFIPSREWIPIDKFDFKNCKLFSKAILVTFISDLTDFYLNSGILDIKYSSPLELLIEIKKMLIYHIKEQSEDIDFKKKLEGKLDVVETLILHIKGFGQNLDLVAEQVLKTDGVSNLEVESVIKSTE